MIRFIAAMALITALAAALRLHNLGSAGLWNDELYTVRSSIAIDQTRLDKRLGYLPTWIMLVVNDAGSLDPDDSSGWQAAGLTPRLIRLPSAIVGILTIPLVMLVGRSALGLRFAIALGFMFAVCPWHIYWSQAARFYSIQVLFMSVSLLAYWVGIRRRSWRWQTLAAAAFGLGVLSQPNAIILAAVPMIDVLWASARRRRWRLGPGGIAAWVVAGVVTAGIIALGIRQGWDSYQQFVGGQSSKGLVGAIKLPLGVAFMLTPVLALGAAVAAIEFFRRSPRAAIFFTSAATVPVLGYSLWALGNNVGLRYLFVAILGLMALGAIGLVRLSSRLRRSFGRPAEAVPWLVVVASVTPLLASYYTSAYGFHPRWAESYAALAERRLPGEQVIDRHPIVASYYLQEPVSLLHPDGATFDAEGRTAILAMEHDMLMPWIDQRAETLTTFDIRTLQPQAEVLVKRIHPRETPESARP